MLNAVITSKDKSGNTIQYPIETFDRPLDWESFKGYPVTFQRLYVEKLKERYNVTQSKLSEMFGIHFSTFSKYCTDHLKVPFPIHKMSRAEIEAFEGFCSRMETQKKKVAYEGENGYPDNHMNQIRLVESTGKKPDEKPVSNKPESEKSFLKMPIVLGENIESLPTAVDASKVKRESTKKKTSLKDLYLKFDGELNTSDILFTLNKLIDEGARGSMIIRVEFE